MQPMCIWRLRHVLVSMEARLICWILNDDENDGDTALLVAAKPDGHFIS